ncbi:MAG: biotin/lipoyl-binding protein [Planctomycetota bacterium]|nr:biotin/lipoyl-binding protein [Planctomycetota bacterium]
MATNPTGGTRYYVQWAGRERVVEIRQGAAGLEVLVDGEPHPADVTTVEGSDLLNLLVDRQSWTYAARFEDGAAMLSFHDREVRVPIEDERGRLARLATGGSGAAGSGDAEIKSVMPGIVKSLLVAVGDAVQAGQPLLILEAMKMENEIRAPRAGAVGSLHVTAGQAVEKGARLVSLRVE